MTEQSTGDVVPERWNAVAPKSNMWMDPAQDPRFAAGTELEGRFVLRSCALHYDLDERDVRTIVEEIRDVGRETLT